MPYFREIASFRMVSFAASQLIIEELAQNSLVNKIYLDRSFTANQTLPAAARYVDSLTGKAYTSTKWTRQLVGADRANQAGFTGKNVAVGIIDTGGTKLHRQTSHMQTYTAMPGLYTDGNGHGEHVASIACGKSARDPALNVDCEGMAPDSTLYSIKALGLILGLGRDSDVLKAFEIASSLKCDIVNLSLGSTNVPEVASDDPLESVITQLTNNGMMIIVSAGNGGPKPGTVTSPGSCKDAITVGAWDEFKGAIAAFSSRGPALGETKPDIIAPGINVDSALTGILDVQSDKRPQRFGYLSGTSMAAPHVTGLLACARQTFKERGLSLTTALAKEVFASSGVTKDNDQGWGLINWSLFENYLKK